MINMKKQAFNAAAILALTASASSHAALTLLPNGGFEATADMGTFADGGNGSTATFETTGGNPNGYGLASSAGGGWGAGFVAVANAAEDPLSLADYGYAGGDTVAFQFDMKDFGGNSPGTTGIKVESWDASGFITGSDVQVDYGTADSTDWETYAHSYTMAAGATGFKVVLVGTDTAGGQIGFDNLYIDDASAVPVPAAAWLFGSALAGLVAVRRKK